MIGKFYMALAVWFVYSRSFIKKPSLIQNKDPQSINVIRVRLASIE